MSIESNHCVTSHFCCQDGHGWVVLLIQRRGTGVKCEWLKDGLFASVIFFFGWQELSQKFWERRFCFEKLLCWVLGYQKKWILSKIISENSKKLWRNIPKTTWIKFSKYKVMKKIPKIILRIQILRMESRCFLLFVGLNLRPPQQKKGQNIIHPKEVKTSRFLWGIFLVAGRFCPQFPYKFAGHQLSSEDVKIVASGSSNLDAIEG